MVTIRMLRDYGSVLPIELWHMRAESLPSTITQVLSRSGVMFKVFEDHVDPLELKPILTVGGRKMYQLKPMAAIHSSFEEIIMIDADNTPLRNIDFLLDHPTYTLRSAVFWPDYWKMSMTNHMWRILDVEPFDGWEFESGQVVLNKRKSWKALHLCKHLNQAYYMLLTNGDKDTFRFAWLATDTPYHFIEARVEPVGMLDSAGDFCGHSMLQHDFDGRPLFLHHNQAKDRTRLKNLNFKHKMIADPDYEGYVRITPAGKIRDMAEPRPYCHNFQSMFVVEKPIAVTVPSNLDKFESDLFRIWKDVERIMEENGIEYIPPPIPSHKS